MTEHLLKWMHYHFISWSHYKSTGAWLNIKTWNCFLFRNSKTDDKGYVAHWLSWWKHQFHFCWIVILSFQMVLFCICHGFHLKALLTSHSNEMTRKIQKKKNSNSWKLNKCFENANRKAFTDEITHFLPPLFLLRIPKWSPWLDGNGSVH